MWLLALETSGKSGTLSLSQTDASSSCELIAEVSLSGGTFSAEIIPRISTLLSDHGLNKNDLAGFAVASGPGSFTGLRVGLAAIKGLAEILRKPIAAVSLLESMAFEENEASNAALKGLRIAASAVEEEASLRITSALDAGRNEIFASKYDRTVGLPHLLAEDLLSTDLLAGFANGSLVLTPDERVLQIANAAGIAARKVPRPTSAAIACLGWRKIQSGDTTSSEQLDALYLRRSDAEIALK